MSFLGLFRRTNRIINGISIPKSITDRMKNYRISKDTIQQIQKDSTLFNNEELRMLTIAGKSKSFLKYEEKKAEESDKIREAYSPLIRSKKATVEMMQDAIKKQNDLLYEEYSPLFAKEFSYEYRKLMLEEDFPELDDETKNYILSLSESEWNKLVNNVNKFVLSPSEQLEAEKSNKIFQEKLNTLNYVMSKAMNEVEEKKLLDDKSTEKIKQKQSQLKENSMDLEVKDMLGYNLKDLETMTDEQMDYFLKKNSKLFDNIVNEGMGEDADKIINSNEFKNFVKTMDSSNSFDKLSDLPGMKDIMKTTNKLESLTAMSNSSFSDDIRKDLSSKINDNLLDGDVNNDDNNTGESKVNNDIDNNVDMKNEEEFNEIKDQMIRYFEKRVKIDPNTPKDVRQMKNAENFIKEYIDLQNQMKKENKNGKIVSENKDLNEVTEKLNELVDEMKKEFMKEEDMDENELKGWIDVISDKMEGKVNKKQ